MIQKNASVVHEKWEHGEPWSLKEFKTNWRHDLVAGIVLSWIAVVFGLSIGDASVGVPIMGLYSTIIAGFCAFAVRGTNVTISGPAAGLSMVLLSITGDLGNGNLAVGITFLGVVITFVAIAQIVIAKMGWGKIGEMFPPEITHAMLAGIGVMLVFKMLPALFGTKAHAHEFLHLLGELPDLVRHMDPKVTIVGVTCLVAVFALNWAGNRFKLKLLQWVPPQIVAVLLGMGLAQALVLDEKFFVHIPNPLEYGLQLPDFAGAFGEDVRWKLPGAIFKLTLIDLIEVLATVAAVDAIDKYQRRSDPNRSLLGIAVGNLMSGLSGRALTNIPGGIKSTLAVSLGARTQWCALFVSTLVLVYLFIGRGVINLMPMAALSAVLLHTGWKMCAPKVWAHAYHLGKADFAVFATTALVTLFTDLLLGIGAGVLTKWFILAWYATRHTPTMQQNRSRIGKMFDLFRSPVRSFEAIGEDPHINLGRPVVCFNFYLLRKELERVDPSEKRVFVHFDEEVVIVDHASAEGLRKLQEAFAADGRELIMPDLVHMKKLSTHEDAMRIRALQLDTIDA